MKSSSKTVIFDVDEFRKNITETIEGGQEEEKAPTVRIDKVKTETKKIIEEKKIKGKTLGKIIFLEGEHKNKTIKIKDELKEIYFDRAKECDIVFEDQKISKKHFKIFFKDKNFYIEVQNEKIKNMIIIF